MDSRQTIGQLCREMGWHWITGKNPDDPRRDDVAITCGTTQIAYADGANIESACAKLLEKIYELVRPPGIVGGAPISICKVVPPKPRQLERDLGLLMRWVGESPTTRKLHLGGGMRRTACLDGMDGRPDINGGGDTVKDALHDLASELAEVLAQARDMNTARAAGYSATLGDWSDDS